MKGLAQDEGWELRVRVCRAWVRTTGEHITQTLSLPGPGLAPINHGTVHAGGMQSI